jgi:SH3-like domain-containing protein
VCSSDLPELSSIPVEPEEPALIPSDPAQSQQSSVSAEEAPLSPPQDAPESGALGWVAAVSLLALPAVGAAVLATLKPGQRLRILKRVKGGWLKVRLQSGQEGYIPEALVSGPEEDAQGALT